MKEVKDEGAGEGDEEGGVSSVNMFAIDAGYDAGYRSFFNQVLSYR